jgi:hypothetical protein
VRNVKDPRTASKSGSESIAVGSEGAGSDPLLTRALVEGLAAVEINNCLTTQRPVTTALAGPAT